MTKPLVLFVDDSETALASTKLASNGLEIETLSYLSATMALNDIYSGKILPQLIVTDMNMPIMNGMEFLKELRNFELTKKTPVLMLTTETREELKAQGKLLGLTGWIVKPFNINQFKMAISRVLRLQ